ncbi:MAG: type IV secretory system conjugative DNA transfer family protein [Anaerolineae bacterium]|nr:type IV secretory system conjugative DNA transfer family protein [Anaerolineae bacterium]
MELKALSNRVVRKRLRGGQGRRGRRLVFAAVFAASTIAAYLWHPLTSQLDNPQRILFSLLGFVTLPAVPLLTVVQNTQRVAALSLPVFAFLVHLCACGGVLTPLLGFVWWLQQPARPEKLYQVYRAEHRRRQNRLTPDEARRLGLVLKTSGLPLASLATTAHDRHTDVIGVPTAALQHSGGHTLVVGPTRCGKGMQATEMLLTFAGPALVIDPKRELWERTATDRQRHVGPIFNIPARHSIDLAAYYDFGRFADIAELHTHLVMPRRERDPIFYEKSLALFTACDRYARVFGLHPLNVLLDLATMDPRTTLPALATVDRDAVYQFTNGADPTEPLDRFAASAWGTFQTRIGYYVAYRQALTGQGETIPTDWIARNATIYVTFSFADLAGASGAMRAILAALMRKQMALGYVQPALLLVDELPTVGLENIDTYLATVGGYGLWLVLYAQTFSQLRDRYGQDKANTILSNCQNQVWYPPADHQTAQRMSELYGTQLAPETSFTSGRRKERLELDFGFKSRSQHARLTEKAALSPADIVGLPDDQVLVQLQRRYRLLAQRLWPVDALATLPRPPRWRFARLPYSRTPWQSAPTGSGRQTTAAHNGAGGGRLGIGNTESAPSISAGQAQQLRAAIEAAALAAGESGGSGNPFGRLYGRLYRHFGIAGYKELPATRFEEALAWIGGDRDGRMEIEDAGQSKRRGEERGRSERRETAGGRQGV